MLDLFFPGRNVAFEISLAPDEVTRRLQQQITAPASPFLDRRTQLFEGSFADGMKLLSGVLRTPPTQRREFP